MSQAPLYCLLNAAEGQLDIHLAGEEKILAAQSWHAPTRGTEILTPALQSLLRIQKLQPADITHFACIYGPGSFTGIRLIMSTVAAMRRASGACNASMDYMQALALTAQRQLQHVLAESTYKNLHFGVLTHARRNLVHAQFFKINATQQQGASAIIAHKSVELCSPAKACDMAQDLMTSENGVYLLGSGIIRNTETFTTLTHSSERIKILPTLVHPCAEALWTLAKEATYHKQDLEPLYVRPCDAVENLDHIAQKQGMDSAKAHEKLQQLLHKPVHANS